MVTSIWRRALRLSYQAWHVLHSALGVLIVLAALGHAFLVNYYFSEPWSGLSGRSTAAAFLWLAVWVRLVKPLRLWRRPWRVVELWPEPGGSLTVGLEPAYRHAGRPFSFQAGQFAWILPGRTPFTPTYHPFSMSSSALRPRVEFTIKQVGDFTSSMRRLELGDTVYVDGPHGSFTLERHPGMGYVFVAAGVGVTPFLSMLATLADPGDQRPCWLFLGNRHEDQVTGVRQLAQLHGRLNLHVVHVISRPSEQWDGERGRIDADAARPAPARQHRSLQYFLCAGEDMVRSVEDDLRGLDVPADRIHANNSEWSDMRTIGATVGRPHHQRGDAHPLRPLGGRPGLTGEQAGPRPLIGSVGSVKKVVVLDYGSGNLRSAERALARVGADVTVTADSQAALDADGLVVPGVGRLRRLHGGLRAVDGPRIIDRRLAGGRPVLGICVGMQILFDSGVEHGRDAEGCGEWPGVVEQLKAPVLPHMGWNTVDAPDGHRAVRRAGRRALLLRALLRRPRLPARRGRPAEPARQADGHLGRARRPLRRRRGERPAVGDPVPPREERRRRRPPAHQLAEHARLTCGAPAGALT